MNVKKKARRVMSGLLTAVTVLSTVLSPAVAYASDDAGSVKKIPYYEEIKDQLDEDEVVTAKDYEIKVGDNFDVKSDYTGLTIQDDSKVKVTFQEAKDTDGNDFSTDYANSYKAVYYVEPQTTDHPTYQINRKIVVKEADQPSRSYHAYHAPVGAEKLLHERKELIDQAEKYREHRPTYKAYMQTKPKKQEDFFESNRVALTLYQSAERYLKEHLGEDKVLKSKAWKAEVADLTQKKSRLYGSLQTLKAEVQEAEAVKKCVEQAVQPEQGKEKTQNKRRDMEL